MTLSKYDQERQKDKLVREALQELVKARGDALWGPPSFKVDIIANEVLLHASCPPVKQETVEGWVRDAAERSVINTRKGNPTTYFI